MEWVWTVHVNGKTYTYKPIATDFKWLLVDPGHLQKHLVKSFLKCEECRKNKIEQLCFVGEDIKKEIFRKLPEYLLSYKTNAAIIRKISKDFKLDSKTATKMFKRLFEYFKYELNFQNFLANKEFILFMHSKEGYEYLRSEVEKAEREFKRVLSNEKEKIKTGEDCLINLDGSKIDKTILKLLDNPKLQIDYYGPFGVLAQLMKISKHDVLILLKQNILKVVEGDIERIITTLPDRVEEEKEELICSKCGCVLDYNDLGLNFKLGNKTEQLMCYKCLGISDEEAISIISFYKSSGCNLFI